MPANKKNKMKEICRFCANGAFPDRENIVKAARDLIGRVNAAWPVETDRRCVREKAVTMIRDMFGPEAINDPVCVTCIKAFAAMKDIRTKMENVRASFAERETGAEQQPPKQ